MRSCLFIVLTTLLFVGGCARVQIAMPEGAMLFEGVDAYHWRVTTSSHDAQAQFDQGLQFMYGFNHDEAGRSFEQAEVFDGDFAMAAWGRALVLGMNINDPEMTEERWKGAFEASQRALSLLDGESEIERALVEALATRYTWPAPSDQRDYDVAYANAMRGVYRRFPEEIDVAVLFAESLMNLQPWDYWDENRVAKGGTEEFIGVLERVLEREPDHPGATHFYIHAMEAGPNPEKATPYADRLWKRVPGVGHLVHMPSHIYVRTGRYADAADVNVDAVRADQQYLRAAPPAGMYLVYYAHNLHFLAFASMMEGRYEEAIKAARILVRDIPEAVLKEFAGLIEGIMPTTYHVMVRFGKWEEILREPLPPDYRLVSLAVHYYARGIAFSALGRIEEAKQAIGKFKTAAANVPEEWFVFNNRVSTVLPIAHAMLEGELAFREGRLDDAWAALRRGIEAEDKLIYDEPPGWMLPVRHAMGALLLSAGNPGEAERLYREDQLRHPGNTWSLLGLQQSLVAQGKTPEAAEVGAKLDVAWKRVKERPSSSCLCEPARDD